MAKKHLKYNIEPFLEHKSPYTIRTYRSVITRFISQGYNLTSEDVIEYLKNEIEQGISTTSALTELNIIKSFAKFVNSPVRVSPRELPRAVMTPQPVFSADDVESLVKFAREKLTKVEAGYFALSTCYGLRVAEMAALTGNDINIDKRLFLVHTKKGGIQRYHYIPDEIMTYMSALHSELMVTHNNIHDLNDLLAYACEEVGIEREERQGWHAMRRALVTHLVSAGIDSMKVAYFMRWKPNAMVFRYMVPDPILADKEIFESHPFLPYWRDGSKKPRRRKQTIGDGEKG